MDMLKECKCGCEFPAHYSADGVTRIMCWDCGNTTEPFKKDEDAVKEWNDNHSKKKDKK